VLQNLLQEQMRNNDVAMRNLESMPGAYNQLRSLFQSMQDVPPPSQGAGGNADNDQMQAMLSALNINNAGAAGQGTSEQSTESTDQSSGGTGPNAAPLPNPWQPNSGDATAAGGNAGGNAAGPLGAMGSGAAPNMAAMSQMMNNPAMRSAMTSMMSNPQTLEAMSASNPQLRQMLSNPMVRSVMSNPQMMEQMMRPEVRQR
jgi:ubiquilin